ncbi:hypothetical protein QOT17_022900 [Balamuthia mandrillaris]
MSHQREVLNALSEAPPLHTRLLFHGQFQEGAHIVGFDLHPVKPLLATATEEGAVIIWNYEKGATVYQFSLAAYEEERGSSKKGGALRCIRFYDHHTRHWKGVLQRQHRGQSDFKALPKLPPWVVIVSETTVVFVDYVTRASREIPLAQLDNKTITCVDYFAYSNLMAFGGSDGQVRLWDTLQWRRAERLQGGQSKAVASLFTYEEDDGTHHLIVAGEEGKFSFWKWKPAGLESYTLNNRTLGGSTSEASSSTSSNFDQNTFSVAASVAEASHSLTPPLSSRTSYEEKNDGRGAQVSTVQPFGGQQRKVHDGSLCGATFDSYTGTLITSGSDK